MGSPPPSAPAFCSSCGAALSSGARFCHRCGTPVAGSGPTSRRERTAWIAAGSAILLTLLVVFWRGGAFRPTVPDMGNAGNSDVAGGAPGLAGRAPDISRMTPRERFDRLYERIIRASESGDTVTLAQFGPMALGAYAQLDSVNTDARYHAGMLDVVLGDFPGAKALADTILAEAPGHLFGYMLRGEAADRQNDAAALTRSYRDFLGHYDREMTLGRIEYTEHRPILDDFKTRAQASLPRGP